MNYGVQRQENPNWHAYYVHFWNFECHCYMFHAACVLSNRLTCCTLYTDTVGHWQIYLHRFSNTIRRNRRLRSKRFHQNYNIHIPYIFIWETKLSICEMRNWFFFDFARFHSNILEDEIENYLCIWSIANVECWMATTQ